MKGVKIPAVFKDNEKRRRAGPLFYIPYKTFFVKTIPFPLSFEPQPPHVRHQVRSDDPTS